MFDPDRPSRRHLAALILAFVGLAWSSGQARADRILLRGGGQVKGKLVADKDRRGDYLLIGEVGRTPMVLKHDQVIQVTPEKGPLDEYIILREQERPTPEAEFSLGLWCEEHGLRDLAQVHYAATLKRDSTFAEAHKKVGHVLMDGRWLDADQLKEAQGMVKYKGRWMLPEEKDRRESQLAMAAEGAGWVKRIKMLRDSYQAGPESRSLDAQRKLLEIREPVAVVPVLRVLGEDPAPFFRSLAAKIIGAIPGPEADRGLVTRLLAETEQPVREATMAELNRRAAADVVPMLARALRSARPEVVNRAAWALAQMNAVVAVPKLIPSLITIEYRVVMSGGSDAPGNLGASFGSVDAAPAGGYSAYGGGSLPVLTPPVVGPGVVAYGATSIPYGAIGSGISLGGGGTAAPRMPTPRVVSIEHHNAEVRAALVKMTGRDFGFDIPTWRRWMATSFRVEVEPSRKVLQP